MRLFKFSAPLLLYFAFFSFFIIGELVFRSFQGKLPPGGIEPWFQDLITANVVAFAVILITEFALAGKARADEVKTRDFITPVFQTKIKRHTMASMGILLMIGIAAIGNPLSNPLGFRQAIQGGGAAYFLVYFLFMEKVYGVYYFNKVYLKTVTLSDTAIVVFMVVFSIFSGFASVFAYFFIYGMIFLNARYDVRVIGFWSILLFTILIILTPIYTMVRENLNYGGADLSIVFDTFWDKILANFLSVIYDRFDYFDLQVAGARVARSHSDIFDIFNALFQFVPRAIWADKPPTYSTMMTQYYAPEVYAIGVTINFGYVNEFILYFGDFGAVIAGLFFGFLVSYSNIILRKKKNTNGILFYTVVLHGYVLAFVGGGYINDLPFAQLIMSLVFYRMLGLDKAFGREVVPKPTAPLRAPPRRIKAI